jgi:uncharacterized protein YdeI (BOF family)
MQKTLYSFIVVLVLFSCNNDPRLKLPQTGNYGVTFTADSVLSVKQVAEALIIGDDIPVTVSGTVTQYCKGEGCWLTLKNDDGEDLFIDVKDKAFVLPYNIENKTAIAHGVAKRDTVEGKIQLSVVADGILIK